MLHPPGLDTGEATALGMGVPREPILDQLCPTCMTLCDLPQHTALTPALPVPNTYERSRLRAGQHASHMLPFHSTDNSLTTPHEARTPSLLPLCPWHMAGAP